MDTTQGHLSYEFIGVCPTGCPNISFCSLKPLLRYMKASLNIINKYHCFHGKQESRSIRANFLLLVCIKPCLSFVFLSFLSSFSTSDPAELMETLVNLMFHFFLSFFFSSLMGHVYLLETTVSTLFISCEEKTGA